MKLGLVSALAAIVCCAACSSSVSSSPVSSIDVTPSVCGAAKNNTVQMKAMASFADGTKSDVTDKATWSTGDAKTATVDSSGVVTGVNAGITSVTAQFEGVSGKVDCGITP